MIKRTTLIRVGVTAAAVFLALGALWLFYLDYLNHPWTRDAQVRANIVGVAPRVSGPIIQIPVVDNSFVKKGDLLFEIDPSTFQAAVASAQAALKKAQADAVQAKQDFERQTVLFKQKVTDVQEYQNSQDQYAAALATVDGAEADLRTAELNLQFTKVFAPVDGYLTNMDTSPGTFVSAGEQLLALIDSTSFWVASYFLETFVHRIQPGDEAEVVFMGHPWQAVKARVASVGWGIFIADGATVDLLPEVSPTVDWVRLAQRFPVRVELVEEPPIPLRIGMSASVAVDAGSNKLPR